MVVGLVVRQEGAFFLTLLTLAGLFYAGASTGVHACFSKHPRLKLSFSGTPDTAMPRG